MKVLDKVVVGTGENEDLPPGWKKEIKVRKASTGKKYDRFYTDPVTGYIFHSFKDVQRYLKTGEVGRLASKPKDNGGSVVMANEDKKVQASVKVEDREQMSETWRSKRPLEEGSGGYNKTRSNISETGKFESPHRASKRLAGVDIGVPPPLPEPKPRQTTQHSSIKVDAPSPSPSPSRPEPKSRQATRQTVIKIDATPSTPSTPSPSPSQPEPKTRQATRQAGIKIDSPPPSPPDIRSNRQATRQAGVRVEASAPPPVEPKTSQATQQAGIEINPSIPPPEPKTRQAARQAGIKIDLPPPSPPDIRSNRQATRQAGVKVDPSIPVSEPKTHQATRQSAIKTDAPPSSTSVSEPKTRRATRQAGIKIDSPPPSPPDSRNSRQATRQAEIQTYAVVTVSASAEPETSEATRESSEATRVTGVEIDASAATPPLEPKTSKATLVTGTESVASPAPMPEPKTRQAKRPAGSRDNASQASPPPTKTRKATRLSGVKIDSPPPSLPDTRTNPQSTARHVNITTSKENDKQSIAKKITNNHHEYTDMNGNKQEISIIVPPVCQASREKDELKTIEEQENRNVLPLTSVNGYLKEMKTGNATLPTPEAQPAAAAAAAAAAAVAVIPPENMEKQELPVVDSTISNAAPQSMSFSLNDLWTDPCIEFAVKTLTGAIPLGDLNKVDNFSPSVPMEEFWTDPCIEFAVKTLTGAISENDYLNHMPASSSNQQARHDNSLPDASRNFCQTEVLSKHVETGHSNKQQDSMVSRVGNGSLQKSGNLVNGSNGQCSRSWFSP